MSTIELSALLASRVWRRIMAAVAFGDSLSESEIAAIIQEALDANAKAGD